MPIGESLLAKLAGIFHLLATLAGCNRLYVMPVTIVPTQPLLLLDKEYNTL